MYLPFTLYQNVPAVFLRNVCMQDVPANQIKSFDFLCVLMFCALP